MSEFEASRKRAPKVPEYQCPNIDNIISAAQEARDNIASFAEDIRVACDDLRCLSRYWRDEAERIADVASDLERERDTLQETVDDLRVEVRDLENMVADLERQLREEFAKVA